MGNERIKLTDGAFGKNEVCTELQRAADTAKTQKNQDISFAQPDTGEGCGQIYAKNQQQRTIQKK